jgi:hypothetical protein
MYLSRKYYNLFLTIPTQKAKRSQSKQELTIICAVDATCISAHMRRLIGDNLEHNIHLWRYGSRRKAKLVFNRLSDE